jgi:signal transduction histidine kinase
VSIEAPTEASGPDWQPDAGPTMAIPQFAGEEALGVLSISRPAGGAAFTEADVDMAFTFAAEASIALEVVRAREDRQRLDTAQDRARIARDLHDHVIQRLFGAGLALQAVSAAAGPDISADIEAQIDAIDAATKDIRTIIFALSSDERRGEKRLRDRLLDVVSEVAGTWTAQPRISFAGPLDSLVSSDLADDLVAVLRELLTNVVKHARAQSVEIAVSIADHSVRLVVADDGRGIPDSAPRSGLANLAERAGLRNGRCLVTSGAGEPTRIEWWVPVHHSDGEELP